MRSMRFIGLVRALGGLAALCVLGACGGGIFDLPTGLTVTEITSTSALAYSTSATVRIRGTDLDQGIRVSAPGCAPLTEVEGGTAFERSYRCTVKVLGPLTVSVIDKTGATLRSSAFQVPAPQVTVATSLGRFVIELNPELAPLSADNFLKYTSTGFYSNLIFHRVIAGFVVQAGGYASGLALVPPTFEAIKLESQNGLNHVAASVAMARTSEPDSASSQFFINLVENASLNYKDASSPGYAVFGKVVSGFDVVGLIGATPTTTVQGLADVPASDVVILSATQTQ